MPHRGAYTNGTQNSILIRGIEHSLINRGIVKKPTDQNFKPLSVIWLPSTTPLRELISVPEQKYDHKKSENRARGAKRRAFSFGMLLALKILANYIVWVRRRILFFDVEILRRDLELKLEEKMSNILVLQNIYLCMENIK